MQEIYVVNEVWNYPGDTGSEVYVFGNKEEADKCFKEIRKGIKEEIKTKYPDDYNMSGDAEYFAAWCIDSFNSAHHKVTLQIKVIK